VAAAIKDINLDPTFADIDRSVRAILTPPGLRYWLWIGFLLTLTLAGGALWTNQIYQGLQVTGLGDPVMWAVYITNFVFWVGIAHSGTLISAILFLFRTRWRTAVYRAAETMTIFAVATAGLFPVIHLGRPWFFYWLVPYPNQRFLQPDFRSPLTWDFFAISTYLTISSLFWFTGLIPDVANVREVATGWRKKLYTIVALGWQGSDRQWRHFSMAYLLLAGLATPLVVSVHTVVSFDFSAAQVAGWHTTIFPPYFVAGAIYSGFAMVMTLSIPIRKFYNLEDFITMRHLGNMAKVMLATGLIVAYGYMMETFMAFYSGNPFDRFVVVDRMTSPPYAYFYWMLIACNIVIPQAMWLRSVRNNVAILFVISLIVNVGMWLERFVIVVISLHRDFLPSSWGMYYPTRWDWATYVGTIGLFLTLLFLFIRFLPVISIYEMRSLVEETDAENPKK
jgi:molybdopterin-containing oxidoreductase family membrane subunit